MPSGNTGIKVYPAHGILGLALLAVFWPLNWLLPGDPTAYLFFPLWLGYVLVVDALVVLRSGTSLWTRSPRDFVLLFLASAPCWWLFEWVNQHTKNWEYLGRANFSGLEYILLASWSFSTVMPAVFETAELVATFPWPARLAHGPRVAPTHRFAVGMILAGCLALLLLWLWPAYFYPLVWLAVFMILDPLNFWLGRRSFISAWQAGDWQPMVSLSLGALICGFFWEMWNYYSFPKWIYHTPGAQFLHIFEMPLLGYGGYLPFAWELYALRNLLLPRGRSYRI